MMPAGSRSTVNVSISFDRSMRRPSLHTGTTPHVSLSIEAWPAADLSMSMLAVVERSAHRRLDAGSSWRDLAVPLPDDFLRRVDRYTKEVWINLLGLPFDHPDGTDRRRVSSRRSGRCRRTRSCAISSATTGASSGARRRRPSWTTAMAGDRAARREFRRTSFPDTGAVARGAAPPAERAGRRRSGTSSPSSSRSGSSTSTPTARRICWR